MDPGVSEDNPRLGRIFNRELCLAALHSQAEHCSGSSVTAVACSVCMPLVSISRALTFPARRPMHLDRCSPRNVCNCMRDSGPADVITWQ